MTDIFKTIAGPSYGEFKDRGSRFLGFAYPAGDEAEALERLEALRREHFKARHHCFAWRLGPDGSRFRANDDGEPGGTAGRPILAQIDQLGLTDVVVVVVRYFGGTLLGTSGLIQAYREAAALALRQATVLEKTVQDTIRLDFHYALMPDVMQAVKKLQLDIKRQDFTDRGRMEIGIRQSEVGSKLRELKALLWKVSPEEADTVGWPSGLAVEISAS